jgi:hypothetical protein
MTGKARPHTAADLAKELSTAGGNRRDNRNTASARVA